MNITVVITGNKELQTKIKRLGNSIYDQRASMAEIGRSAAVYYANQGFNSQGGVFGSPWQRLSPRYAAWKAKNYPGRPPLVRTGKMQNSFDFQATSSTVLIGNSSPQFKYHQSSAPRRVIPRRASIGVNDQIKRMVREAISRDISQKLKRA